MKIFLNLWSIFNHKDKINFFILIFFSLLQGVLELMGIALVIPFVTILLNPNDIIQIPLIGTYLSELEYFNSAHTIYFACLIFFLIFLFKNILIFITNKFAFNFVFKFRKNLFLDLINKILSQNYLFFSQKSLSEIHSTTTNELNSLITNVLRPTIILVSELIILSLIIILVLASGYASALYVLVPIVILITFILKRINKNIKGWSKQRVYHNQKIVDLNRNLMQGIKEIFLFSQEKKIFDNFKKSLNQLSYVDIKNNILTGYPKLILEQSVVLILVIIILVLFHKGYDSDGTIIVLSFYLAAAYRIIPSLNKISISYQQIKFGKISIKKLIEILKLNNKKNLDQDIKIIDFKFSITLQDINFRFYSGKTVLENVNLELKKNKIIGLFAKSGSGKSTLINLITRLIKPDSGQILIDNKNIEKLENLKSYQNLFSICSQDTFILDSSIKNNILFGSNHVFSEQRMKQAIKYSCLAEYIKELPLGIETDVGMSVKQLSSGQKQRIAIARTIYNDRKILIFDEATNALDEQNENILFDNIKTLKEDKIIIIISHNINNLRICDEKFTIKNNSLIRF